MVTIDEFLPNGTWAPRKFEVQEYLKQNADPRDVIVCDQSSFTHRNTPK